MQVVSVPFVLVGGNGAGSLSVICSRCLLVVVVQNV